MKEEQDLEFQPTHPHPCNVCLRTLFYFNTGVVKPQPMEHSCLSNSPTATKKMQLWSLPPTSHYPSSSLAHSKAEGEGICEANKRSHGCILPWQPQTC